MWEKIKAFFEKKATVIVEGIVMAVCAAGMIIGGVKVEEISKLPALVGGALLALEAVITFIQGLKK